ncbi:hypothetical protein N2152v2_006367 [Parachlorella kessleri]
MKLKVAGIASADLEEPADFLLVPQASEASSTGHALAVLTEAAEVPLPLAWKSFFDCLAKAKSRPYIEELACSGAGFRGPALETLAPDSVCQHHLSVEALVLRHGLGVPEIRRLYQALQVYSLGFHQTISEVCSHAVDRANLLVAVWRGYGMLWDGALQTVFASDTVKLSNDQKAAVLSAEAAYTTLRECEASKQAVDGQNAALTQRLEDLMSQLISAKADASVLESTAVAAVAEARQAQQEKASLAQHLNGCQSQLYAVQAKLQDVGAPQLDLTTKLDRANKLLEEKQAQLTTCTRKEAAMRQERDDARNLVRSERLKKEAAEAQVLKLQTEVEDLGSKLQTLQIKHADVCSALANQRMLEDRLALLADADSKAGDWKGRAEAGEARVIALEQELQAARSKNDELVDSYWPLAAKLKALEAQMGSMPTG